MLNDITKTYDRSLSIRQILKRNKIDINFMNWIAGSSVACSKLKRLCIRISKKKTKKSVFLSSQAFFSYSYEKSSIFEFIFHFADQKILHVETSVNNQIKLMMKVSRKKKAFRISCIIRIDMFTVSINRGKVQADQNSDLNVIFMNMIRKFNLELFDLNFIEFREFIMKTADHKKFPLRY